MSKFWITFILLCTAVHARGAAGLSRAAASSSELLLALSSNPEVDEVVLTANIELKDASFLGFPSPLFLSANITITGQESSRSLWPRLDLAYLKDKVRLAPGVFLIFSRVVLDRAREPPLFQAIGLDLLLDTSGRNTSDPTDTRTNAVALFQDAIIIQRSCLPPTLGLSSSATLSRPPICPGSQRATPTVVGPAPGCVEGEDAPPALKCYAGEGEYVDTASYGISVDAFGRTARTGYAMWSLNVTYKCELMLTEECVSGPGGPLGCFRSALPRLGPGGVVLAPPTNSSLFPGVAPEVILGGSGTVPGVPGQAGGPGQGSMGAAEGGTGAVGSGGRGGRGGGGGGGALTGGEVAGVVVGVVGGVSLLALATVLGVRWARRRPHGRRDGVKGDAVDRSSPPQRNDLESHSRDSRATAAEQRTEGQQIPGQQRRQYGTEGGGGGAGGTARSPGPTASPGAEDLESALRPSNTVEAGEIIVHVQGSDNVHVAHEVLESALVPVTPLAPFLPDIPLDVQSNRHNGPEPPTATDAQPPPDAHRVTLLPTVIGRGACGKVVEGLYGGRRVAVKVIDTGLMPLPLLGLPGPGGVQARGVRGTASEARGGGGGLLVGVGGGSDGTGADAQSSGALAAFVKLLAQEVEVLARCRHGNVVRLLAANLRPPLPMLVLERMDTSLERILAATPGRRLGIGKALHIGTQVARALAYLHPTILHRDIKPANVLISNPLSDTPVVKLADFGLSRLRSTALITQHPEVGTAPYMAPECFDINNFTITDRADMYSLGIVLWELVAGQQPWQGLAPVAIAFTVAMERRRPLLDPLLAPGVPVKLAKLVRQCWDPDPRRRPAASEAVKQLVLAAQEVR